MTPARLHLVQPAPSLDDRLRPSRRFLALTRNPALAAAQINAPRRFEPTVKREGDVIL
jgi:hypothetical protein